MISLQQLLDGCRRVFHRHHGEAPPCGRCDGHGTICIYDTSDEYAAPCPVCKGPAAYHAQIARRNSGAIPFGLRWPEDASPTSMPQTGGEA